MFDEVKNFLLRYTDAEAGEITPETGLGDIGIDSMKLFEIIADFEKQFGVKVSDKQLGELFTVQDLIRIAEKNNGKKHACFSRIQNETASG